MNGAAAPMLSTLPVTVLAPGVASRGAGASSGATVGRRSFGARQIGCRERGGQLAAGLAAAAATRGLCRTRRGKARNARAGLVLRAEEVEEDVAITEASDTRVVKRELNDRQQQFWEMLEEDFEEDVVPEFGRENLLRIYEFIKYCKYEKEIPELPDMQEIDPEYFPGLRAQPWWEVDEIDTPEWVEKVVAGLPYVQGELADLLEDNEEYLISDSVQNDVMGGGWSGFRLRRLGAWLSRNCELFPKTVQLLKQSDVPLAMRGVIVARQVPETGVQPHSDGRNFFLTAHFGLSVPPDCSITVGGEERQWKEDDCIILDTSFIHSTKNDSDEDRFVLVVDFWHPDLTIPEREALEWIYDFRNKFEQGKIKYVPKLPDGFWETLYVYSAWGGAYTEETIIKQPAGPDTLGGFRLGSF
ncbi:unnamed protein product [Effrenium voratum]|uniref:Aspartyl/asparaginy/proline hydroxylase domain-containing protein n=1 Tax=Effrenium voratum TaxID=2562239 RepID=A0AA36ISQ3_9DINO|nr:unnamed protein product [Effrenium voratum]